MDDKKSRKKVFIFCYADYTSGGPEALHQLRYYMEQQNIDAWMVYIERYTKDVTVPPQYLKYFPQKLKYIGELNYIDKSNHLIVMPESMTYRLLKFRKSVMAIWWLSVGAYDGRRVYLDDYTFSNSLEKNICKLKYRTRNLITILRTWYLFKSRKISHYCGSQYAYDYLKKQKKKGNLLVEPIGKGFLDYGGIFEFNSAMNNRSYQVLYNPSKPSKIMDALLENKKFDYFPLKGYSENELINIYRNSRLYIDFGSFPGPERLPKETVYNGCNILVGRRNAAKNNFDVAIPEKYKISDLSVAEIEEKIQMMLDNYEEDFYDFSAFREKTKELEVKFINSIQTYFSDYVL